VEPPSGAQVELRKGAQRLVVVEVGAGLREYEVEGQPILDGFPIDRIADGARGQPLLPWPNRLADGRYAFRGQRLQLPIDELGRNNAIHGLTRWLNWTLADRTDYRATLQLMLHPRPGYPFTLWLQLQYVLGDTGFTVSTNAQNRGAEALPFGAGQHPYFSVAAPRVDGLLLRIPSQRRLELDAERRLPTGRILPIEHTDTDFRELRPIGPTQLDECYCDLERASDGRIQVTLGNPETGRSITLWADHHSRYLQVFSGDTLAPERRRRGLALEPMTCPPNAFGSQIDLITLEPDERIDLEWGVEIESRI
jgi:aldose 1-epimerase